MVAFVVPGESACPICAKAFRVGDEIVTTSGVFLPEDDPLVDHCDAAMHVACAARWPHRERFCRAWFEARRDGADNDYWAVVWSDDDAFVTVNPFREVVHITSAQAFAGCELALSAWADAAAPTRHDPRETAALAALWSRLRAVFPDGAALLARVDRAELLRRQQATREAEERARVAAIAAMRAERLARRAFNRAAVRFDVAMREGGAACPHCGAARRDHRFVDENPHGRRSYFVCAACARHFTPEGALPPPYDPFD